MSSKLSQQAFALPAPIAGVCASVLLAVLSSPARATPELPVQYDARSLGMGGTGAAYTDSAAAAVVNPAGLAHVEELTVTAVAAPFMPSGSAPFSDGVETDADRVVVPLFFAGGAYRLHERVVLGLAAYAASGAGARYSRIHELEDMPLDLSVAVLELAMPVSFEVTDDLSVGAGLRFAYAFVSMDLPVEMAPALPPARVQNSMSGTAFPGGVFGVQYRPTPFLALGLSYRTKMSIDLDGDGDVTADFLGGRQPVLVETAWATAHAFRAGAKTAFGELTLALDVTYTLLDDAIDSLPLEFTMQDGTTIDPDVELEWENSLGGFLGAEYVVARALPVRVGFALVESGTPAEYADARMPPPGLMRIFTLGAGYESDDFQIDLGGAYAVGGEQVESTPNGAAGRYDGDFIMVSTSLSYRN